jgi:hypothetical protein
MQESILSASILVKVRDHELFGVFPKHARVGSVAFLLLPHGFPGVDDGIGIEPHETGFTICTHRMANAGRSV